MPKENELSGHESLELIMLLIVASAQLAWFIPGLILRRRYLKAKLQHV